MPSALEAGMPSLVLVDTRLPRSGRDEMGRDGLHRSASSSTQHSESLASIKDLMLESPKDTRSEDTMMEDGGRQKRVKTE